MASSYYYARNGERFGPVSGGRLKELAASGQLAPEDLVWKDGMPGWEPAKKLKGLFPSTPAAGQPPPLPLPTSAPSVGTTVSSGEPASPLFEIDEPTVPASTADTVTPPGGGWEHRLGRFQPMVDRYSRQLEIGARPLIALAAGAACLLLLALATFLTWESYRQGMSMPVGGTAPRIEEVWSHLGVAHAEGKTACVLAVGALVFLGVAWVVKRLLPASLLAASGAGTGGFLLAAIYGFLIRRYVSETKQELDNLQRVMGVNETGEWFMKTMDMRFSGGASLGIYLTMLLALAAAAAFFYASLHKPLPLPFLNKEGVSPFLQKYGALLAVQGLALVIGLIWFVTRS